ncbi:cytochrome c oxidase subunit 7C, mitochondrial-like [Phyllostomus hastatus]|uniref:cytochrome c oxidase subunit 7C, mitochondrial-like n=1 Tax=Phyllostomus hastatus TaxID=9423 RepID=UPI001E682614|nr:cytochrome c oxidase subunit 7C, mitochondrial-like [Phyllostomus hastatus]
MDRLSPFLEASNSKVLGQSIRRSTTSVVHRSRCEEGPGKNLPFLVEKKWRFPAMKTVYVGSGFATPFFIVSHQLLKNKDVSVNP